MMLIHPSGKVAATQLQTQLSLDVSLVKFHSELNYVSNVTAEYTHSSFNFPSRYSRRSISRLNFILYAVVTISIVILIL